MIKTVVLFTSTIPVWPWTYRIWVTFLNFICASLLPVVCRLNFAQEWPDCCICLVMIQQLFSSPFFDCKTTPLCTYLVLSLCRSFWRHVLLPSSHPPEGDGLIWRMAHENNGPLNDIVVLWRVCSLFVFFCISIFRWSSNVFILRLIINYDHVYYFDRV